MRVIAYPADQGGCGFYRLIAPCRHLIAQGVDVDYIVDNDPEDRQMQALWRTNDDDTVTVVDVLAPSDQAEQLGALAATRRIALVLDND